MVRITAIYDFILVTPFSAPPFFHWFKDILQSLNVSLGGQDWPTFLPLHVLFVSMFGVLGLTWSVARLIAPTLLLGRIDGLARLAVVGLFISSSLVVNVPLLYWIGASELIIGLYLVCVRVAPSRPI